MVWLWKINPLLKWLIFSQADTYFDTQHTVSWNLVFWDLHMQSCCNDNTELYISRASNQWSSHCLAWYIIWSSGEMSWIHKSRDRPLSRNQLLQWRLFFTFFLLIWIENDCRISRITSRHILVMIWKKSKNV